MPSTPRVTQGGKLGRSGAGIGPVSAFSRIAHAVGKERSAGPAGRLSKAVAAIRKAVVNAVWMQFQAFIKNFPRRPMVGFYTEIELQPWNLRPWNLKAPTRRSLN